MKKLHIIYSVAVLCLPFFFISSISVVGQTTDRFAISGTDMDTSSVAANTVIFPDNVDDLHEAVANTPKGGTLIIKPGVYKIDRMLDIDEDINIIGSPEKPESVVIEGGGNNVQTGDSITCGITAERATLTGLTFQNFDSEEAKKVEAERKDYFRQVPKSERESILEEGLVTIFEDIKRHCVLVIGKPNLSGGKTGPNRSRFNQCIFSYADSGFTAGGVDTEQNEDKEGTEQDKANPSLYQCRFTKCRAGVVVSTGAIGTFKDCEITGNDFGMIVCDNDKEERIPGGNPVVRDCSFRNNAIAALCIDKKSGGTYEGNEFSGNGKDTYILSEKVRLLGSLENKPQNALNTGKFDKQNKRQPRQPRRR
jgi:hypothetical protein